MGLTPEQRRVLLQTLPQQVLEFLQEGIETYEDALWHLRKTRGELVARLVFFLKALPPEARSDRWFWRKLLQRLRWSDKKTLAVSPIANFLSVRSARHLRRLARKIAASIPETEMAVAYARALSQLSSDFLSERVLRPFKVSPDDIEAQVNKALQFLELAFHHPAGGLWVLVRLRELVHRLEELRRQQLSKMGLPS